MQIEPADLANLPLDSFEPNACTPSVDDDEWRGIVIRTATRVLFAAEEIPVVPVSGYSLLDIPLEPVTEPLTLFCESPDGLQYWGFIESPADSPVLPLTGVPPLTAEDVEGLAASGYFNCDLVSVCGLVRPRGAFTVWVQFRGLRSNATTVDLFEIV